MKRILIVFLLAANLCNAQGWQADFMAGGAGYAGDLTSKSVSLQTIHAAFGLNARYSLTNQIVIRAGLTYGKVGGQDKKSSDSMILARNLSFETNILEGSICGEYNLLSPELFSIYPYVFAGVGFFHFNPYTYDNSGKKVYLPPLSTEGEGLSEYPLRKKYSLNQFCIPFGGGVKWRIADQYEIALEAGVRKLFTDYLDDVSKRYVDYNTLLTERGPEAVELAYRGSGPYPNGGSIRGNSGKNDIYYVFGIKLIYSFANEANGYGIPQRLY
jgi:hypothetical protein